MRDIREELEQQASFWRAFINECPQLNDESMNRMRDSLMVIECKLTKREVEE
jgi:hypothetical protein